jgi:hypothetical protein
MAKNWRVLGLIGALALVPLDSGAQGFAIEKVALDGEEAPGAGGATFTSVDVFAVDVNASGHVAYGATLSMEMPNWGVFVHAAGSGSARAISGDPAPAPLGGTYFAFGRPHIDSAGGVSMGTMIRLPSTEVANALVLATGGGDSILVSEFDTAPGGGTFEVGIGDTNFHARAAGGPPVFQSDVIGGAEGVFAGTATAIARAGDDTPAGGTYASFTWPGANASGVVAFPAELSGADAAFGLFVDSGSGAVTIALEGDLEPLGETFYDFALPAVNSSGDVLFLGGWVPDGSTGGLYVSEAAGLRSVVRTGQPLPNTGGSVDSLGGTPDFADGGGVSFSAVVTGGDVASGVFFVEPSGPIRVVALAGDPVPGAPAESFASFVATSVNAAGQVAFGATTSGGSNGVFLATEEYKDARVPALSPPALLGLLALLVTAAAAVMRHHAPA